MAKISEQDAANLFPGEKVNEVFRVFIVTVGTIVLLTGIIGNDLLLVVLFKRRQDRRFRNIFIVNLVVADVVVITASMPFFLLDLVLGHHPVANQPLCSANAFLLGVSYLVSMLSLVVVSCHRYVKVCHRHVFHKLFNARRNRFVCLALWLLAVVTNTPLFWLVPGYGYDSWSRICNSRAGRITPGYGSITMICMLVVSILLIGFFNVSIFKRWYGSRRKLRSSRRGMKIPKATWKSFLSMSANNIASLDYSDSLGDVRKNVGLLTQSRLRNSECYSDLTSSTVYTASSDCDIEMRDVTRPVLRNPDPFIQINNDVIRNTNEGVDVSRRISFCPSDHPKAGSVTMNNLTRSRNLDKESRKLYSRRRRASLLCEALDLNTVVPFNDIPEAPDDDDDDDVFKLDHKQEEGASGSLSPAVKLVKWNDGRDGERNSIPLYLDLPGVDRKKRQRKKSLYPSIDRRSCLASRSCKATKLKKPPSSDMALVRSLLVISICLFVLYTPYVIVLILTFVIQNHLPAEVYVTSTLLLFVNCAINWAVYGVMNTAFRQAYVTTVKNFWQSCSRFRRRTASAASSVGPVSHHPDQ